MPNKLTLLDKRELKPDIFEFVFEKPQGFTFQAGQALNVKLPELLQEDPKGPRRVFTIASAPHEEHILITTRITSSRFKKSLQQISAGTEIEFAGPFGNFVLKDLHVLMIAGGIGITPFRSMIMDSIHRHAEHDIVLLYSFSKIDESAYHDLFLRLAKENSRITYIPTITRTLPEGLAWDGENSRIDMAFIQKHVRDFEKRVAYLCGPPAMVDSLKGTLQETGLNVVSESFWGY